eukprot:m.145195 g.145195  ORF g.145195 m.145195 type:complete len:117 (+) comp16061_c2_seq6:2748-3098(+)
MSPPLVTPIISLSTSTTLAFPHTMQQQIDVYKAKQQLQQPTQQPHTVEQFARIPGVHHPLYTSSATSLAPKKSQQAQQQQQQQQQSLNCCRCFQQKQQQRQATPPLHWQWTTIAAW